MTNKQLYLTIGMVLINGIVLYLIWSQVPWILKYLDYLSLTSFFIFLLVSIQRCEDNPLKGLLRVLFKKTIREIKRVDHWPILDGDEHPISKEYHGRGTCNTGSR